MPPQWWSLAKSDTVSGEKFGWSESWGEQHETVISPQLYTLDVGAVMHAAAAGVNTGTPVRAVMHPDFAGTDRSLGQPKW